MIEVKVERFSRGISGNFRYEVTIRHNAHFPTTVRLTRDEYESLILQLIGQLARLDEEATK